MIEKLEAIKQRYDLLTEKIADPAVIARMDEWKKIAKERADMEETVEKYVEYKKVESDKISAEQSLATESDPDMKELLEEDGMLEKEEHIIYCYNYWRQLEYLEL